MMKVKERRFKSHLAVSLDDLVPQDHFYRQLEDVLDLNFVRDWVKHLYAPRGRGSVDPMVFFKLQLIMYFEGIRSERDLIEQVKLNLAYRWYIGYDLDEAIPDHSSLTRIRNRLGLRLFQQFFDRIVELCIEAGLVWGEELYFDGTMSRANAAGESFRPRLEMVSAALIEQLFERRQDRRRRERSQQKLRLKIHHLDLVEAFRDWNSPGNRSGYRRWADDFVSRTDPDATPLRPKNNQRGRLGYHTQYVVDGGQSRIILGTLVTKATVPDHAPMLDLLKRIHIKHHLKPRQVVGDAKFGTARNIGQLEQMGIRAYLAQPRYYQLNKGFFSNNDFVYDPHTDMLICPNGYELKRHHFNVVEELVQYQSDPQRCNTCRIKYRCTTSPDGRRVRRSVYQDYVNRAAAYPDTTAYQKAMRKRRVWIEPKFGEAKMWHRLAKFQLRGLHKVNIEALLIASVQNLKQLIRHQARHTPPVGSHPVAKNVVLASFTHRFWLFVPRPQFQFHLALY